MPGEGLLRRYADLAVRVGANVGEGQDVLIRCFVEHAPLARALAAAAYEAGARYVAVDYGDTYLKRELIRHADDDTLEWSPPWQLAQLSGAARSDPPSSTACVSARHVRRSIRNGRSR